MRNRSWACAVCLLCLGGGCHLLRPDGGPGAAVEQAGLASRVRDRLPKLKAGMTEPQVREVLGGLPLGEEVVVAMTISGGKTAQYAVPPGHVLELTFIPQALSESRPGQLANARLFERPSPP